MKLNSCGTFTRLILLTVGLSSAALAAALTPTLTSYARADAGCFDLAGYLSQVRALPDTLSMHHQLVDLNLRSSDGATQPSDLATQHALDLFYHPNLVTLGLAAAKNGGSYLHDFTAYQLDCAKVVTGDIFAAEGMSVSWGISAHTANSLTLTRLTQGGNAEITTDLTLVLRRFQSVSPTTFAVTSAYSFDTPHDCGTRTAPAPSKETNVLTTTELFSIDSSNQDPWDVSSDGLKALFARFPRTAAPAGHRGAFVNPVTPAHDSACIAAPVTPAPHPAGH